MEQGSRLPVNQVLRNMMFFLDLGPKEMHIGTDSIFFFFFSEALGCLIFIDFFDGNLVTWIPIDKIDKRLRLYVPLKSIAVR